MGEQDLQVRPRRRFVVTTGDVPNLAKDMMPAGPDQLRFAIERMPEAAGEYSMARTYLEWLTELPWSVEAGKAVDIAEARRVLATADGMIKNELNTALAEARGKAQTIVKGMRDTLAAEMEQERTALEAQIAAKLVDAEARIAQTKAAALAGVGDIAGELAGAIVARLSGREVSKDEVQKALVNRQAAE